MSTSQEKPLLPTKPRNIFSLAISTISQSETGAIALFFFVLTLVVSIIAPRFLDVYNLGVITRQASFVALVALAQMVVLIGGGIDLSVGSIAGLAGILAAMLMINTQLDPYLSMFLAILIGASIGLLNGILVNYIGLNAFIATLSMSFIVSGVILVITKGWALPGIPEKIQWIGKDSLGPVPWPTVITIVIAILLTFLLKKTYVGRHIYALGGNMDAAILVGIRVKRLKTMLFVLSATLSSLAGVIMLARLASGQPSIGATWLLPSFTAAILGGTAMNGGIGSPLGTIIGAAIMGVIQNGIVMSGMSVYWENIVVGGVLILAIFLDTMKAKIRHR
jgi:ribose transport system permease protein